MLGMQPKRGHTILLTGPPGAGKTRTSLVWSATRTAGAFAIDWDYARSTIATADELRAHPSGSVGEQYQFAARVIAAQADSITSDGVDCIVVGAKAPSPPPEFAAMWNALEPLDPITIVLLPSPDVCARRNATDPTRIGRFAVPDQWVRDSYESWGWRRWSERPRAVVIDTSAMTPSEVVEAAERA